MGHLTGTARQTGTSNILRDAGGKLGGITHPSTSMCRRPVNLRSCFFVFFFVASILREQLIRGPSTPREVCARGPTSSAYAFFFFCSVRRSAILRQLFFRGTSFAAPSASFARCRFFFFPDPMAFVAVCGHVESHKYSR